MEVTRFGWPERILNLSATPGYARWHTWESGGVRAPNPLSGLNLCCPFFYLKNKDEFCCVWTVTTNNSKIWPIIYENYFGLVFVKMTPCNVTFCTSNHWYQINENPFNCSLKRYPLTMILNWTDNVKPSHYGSILHFLQQYRNCTCDSFGDIQRV